MKTLFEKCLPKFFRDTLERIIDKHNGHRAGSKDTVCSSATRKSRKTALCRCFAELWMLGYRIKDPSHLGSRHIEALTAYWRENGTCLETWHTKLSFLRTFSAWIGKPRMVGDVQDYFLGINTRRRTAAVENRAWLPNGVSPKEVIEMARAIDPRFAIFLELQNEFGLRMKESIEMRPARCLTESGESLEIFAGTKGGRSRRIKIVTEQQREVFERAREMASRSRSGRLRWPDTTWRQAQRRFYYLAKKIGITRGKLGVTAHGLRHGYAQEKFMDLTGELPPVMGGDPKRMDSDTFRQASQHVARDLGHGRPDVGKTYYGSHGHAMRKYKNSKTHGGEQAKSKRKGEDNDKSK